LAGTGFPVPALDEQADFEVDPLYP
jgi:hypothetical protein